MSNNTTNWIIELVDKVTAPAKAVAASVIGTENAAQRASNALDQMGTDARAAEKAIGKHKDLTEIIESEEKRVKGLKKGFKSLMDGDSLKGKVKLDIHETEAKVKRYKGDLKELEHQLDIIAKKPDAAKAKENWAAVALGANQAWEITERLMNSMTFATGIVELEGNLKRMTGATGDALDDMTSKVHTMSKVYGDDSMQIARAANATAKQMGISFDEAMGLIEAGYQKGANLNGDMLDQLKEYAPHMKQAGMSAAEGIALMAKAGQDGIMSDKAMDAIKEAGLSLREMNQIQVDALHGIGLEVEDLAGKTTFEAVRMISQSMEGATTQAKQLVIADIFKGAGEDAGIGFVEGLGSIDLDPNNIPSVEAAGTGLKTWLGNMESSFASSFGKIAVYGQQFGGTAQVVTSMIPIVQGLTKVTWLQNIATKAATAGQWLMNAAFNASPLGWIVMGLTAVSLAANYVWDNFEAGRGAIMGMWYTFKQVFSNIADLFKVVFAPIGEAMAAISNGDWGGAAKAIFKLNPISMASRTIGFVNDGGLSKGLTAEYQKGKAAGVQSFRDDKAAESAGGNAATGSDGFSVLDGHVADAGGAGGNKKKGKGGASGLSIGSAGGGNEINMELTVNNYFSNVSSSLDIRDIANQVVQQINGNIKDALINHG